MATRSTARRPATKQAAGPSRLPLVLGGLAVVVLALVIAVFTTADRDREGAVAVADLAGNPIVTGDPLPSFGGDPASDGTVGTRAPVITGEDFDGTTVTLGESGDAQLLMFLASWCPACQAELPEVVGWLEDGNLPEDVELKAIATGLNSSQPNWPPDAWFEREGYEGPVLVDSEDGAVAEAFGLTGTPYWVALDSEGQVVARISGMIETAELSRLAETLSGR